MAEQNTSEEVDLGYFFKSIGGFFKKLVQLLFLVIAFFLKYIIITVILIIVGIAIGYFLDNSREPVYTNELIVIPNFESSDYLYQDVESLKFKKKAHDTVFFNSILGEESENLLHAEIEPIIDVYSFTAEKNENLETLKILYNDKDLEEFLKSRTISKHYKYHKLTITCKGKNSKKITEDLLKYFNSNEHFKAYQKITRRDTEIQIAQNEKMVSQIDSILKRVSENTEENRTQSVYINTQSDLYQMINSKQALLNRRLELRKKFIDQDEIIKLVSGNYNLDKGGIFSLPNMIKIPIYLLLLFSGFFFFIYIYKRLKFFSEEK